MLPVEVCYDSQPVEESRIRHSTTQWVVDVGSRSELSEAGEKLSLPI